MYFDKMIKDVKDSEPQKTITVNFAENPRINMDFLRSKKGLIDIMPEEELFKLINACYDVIIMDINSGRMEYVNAYISMHFLNQFARVTGTSDVTTERKRACAKLAYLYHISTSPNKTEEMAKLYDICIKLAFRDILPILIGLGIPEKLGIDLLTARYSNIEEEIIAVRRVNFIIQNGPMEIMTVQKIVNIYEKLFDRMTPLFKGTMFDVIDEDEEWVTDPIIEIDSRISLAVLELLNNMTMDQIRQVIISYTDDYVNIFKEDRSQCRFSIVALSEDYSRVRQVSEQLREEGYSVP